MDIPKRIKKDNRHYIFIKEYENLVLYQDVESKLMTCFRKNEFIKRENEKVKHPRFNFIIRKMKRRKK